jgi:hypothetical protein
MSVINQSNLLPFVQKNESEVINMFALDGTGLGGLFVTMQTGNGDPALTAGSYGTQSVGASYANATSLRHLVTRRVQAAAAGDVKAKVLGVTLHTVAEYDENGNKLINWPAAHSFERGFVPSGQAVPILQRGIITIKKSQVTNEALPGMVGIAGANGTLVAVDAADAVTTATGAYTLGRFISSSGSAFGGYYQFQVQL